MKLIFVRIIVCFLAVVMSCQQRNYISGSDEGTSTNEKTAVLMNADNQFGLQLFRQVRSASSENNLLISPLSISAALNIAYNGANGDTRSEMEKMLKLNGLSVDQINNAYQNLMKGLQSTDPKVTFEIANALFYSHAFKIKPGFMNVGETVYNAEIMPLDFSKTASVNTINNWVDEKTHGKISEIINQLNPLDRMVLLNAIYFYGTWSKEFDEHGTQMKPFTKGNGSKLEVPMMSKTDEVPYLVKREFKAIKIPYGTGSYNMIVLLPEEGFNSTDLIEGLTNDRWKKYTSELDSVQRVKIAMPRFKFEFEISLNDVLSKMGMQKAFTPKEADFSRISDEDLHLSAVKHKTYIDVNETGTEAAAVTAGVFTTTSMIQEPPFVSFVVDKPFIFAITEKDSGSILFIGEVNHPEYKQ